MNQLTLPESGTADLTDDERAIAVQIEAMYDRQPRWIDFANFWRKLVLEQFDSRQVPRRETVRSSLYRFASDLDRQLKLTQGIARPRNYRDDLFDLAKQYPSLQQFATELGLSDEMISGLIYNRQELPVAAFDDAIGRVGYMLKLVPIETA